MNQYRAIATIFFRVFGVTNIIYSLLYFFYAIFVKLFQPSSSSFITVVWASIYLLLGTSLIAISSRLSGLIVRGLDQPTDPPPPPSFVG
ncbi:MAG TPA: hypothetical protein VLB68_03075 [Pyrinomonadaceae bacterium]|nr:hypothetical protein [Pyrinomonadaceae bacterium]